EWMVRPSEAPATVLDGFPRPGPPDPSLWRGSDPVSTRTPLPKISENARRWVVMDADGKVLGRLATVVARHLTGKTKAIYTPFLDVGDFVVVVNAEKIALTGNKLERKVYHRYTGFPGGLRSIGAAKL